MSQEQAWYQPSRGVNDYEAKENQPGKLQEYGEGNIIPTWKKEPVAESWGGEG